MDLGHAIKGALSGTVMQQPSELENFVWSNIFLTPYLILMPDNLKLSGTVVQQGLELENLVLVKYVFDTIFNFDAK